MLIKKSAELVSDNFSFCLPENFFLELCTDKEIKLVSEDGGIEILLRFELSDLSCEEAFDNFFYKASAIQIGDYFNIKRGNGTALAVYCEFETQQTYLERYKFDVNSFGENTVSFSVVSLDLTIYEVLELPEVKAFIKSIKYF